jgi:hypothetical protein
MGGSGGREAPFHFIEEVLVNYSHATTVYSHLLLGTLPSLLL